MKEFFSSLKFKILVCICALLAGFVLYAVTNKDSSNFLEKGLDFIITPIRSASAYISESVSEFFEKYIKINQVYEENGQLKEEIARLKEQLANFDSYKLENERLKDFLHIKELNPEFELETALVIGNDPLDSFGSFTINKGSVHDISTGDVVISSDGLVGIVSGVNLLSSNVSTILDPSVQTGAFISSTNDVGIIKNTVLLAKDDCTQLTMLSRESKAQVGDFVITSGSGGVFPSGIMIGTIESIQPDSNGLSLNAVIRPSANIRNIKDVVVIKSFLGQGELPDKEDASSENGGE